MGNLTLNPEAGCDCGYVGVKCAAAPDDGWHNADKTTAADSLGELLGPLIRGLWSKREGETESLAHEVAK